MIHRPGAARIAGVVMLVAAIAVGCSASDVNVPATGTATATATTSATSTATSDLRGAHVHVLGLWSGPEFASFEAVTSAWEKETGAIVDWEGTQDLSGALARHAQAGDSPDIAILPNLALMNQLADAGTLIPLDSVLDMTADHQGLRAGMDRARQPWRQAVRHLLQGHEQGGGLVQPEGLRGVPATTFPRRGPR